MARKKSIEAYVYWYYNKYDFKTYFGSRANYEGSYKDDFIANYNSSSEDEEFLKALENGELVGEVIAVFTGGTYKEVGKRAVAYENDLIELYWDNVGKDHSYNHYANGKFSRIGTKASEEEIENNRNAQLKRYEDPKEHEKSSKAQLKRYEDPKEHEKTSIKTKEAMNRPEVKIKTERNNKRNSELQKKRYEDPKEHEKTSIATKKGLSKPEVRETISIKGKKRFENIEEREKQSQRLINNPKTSKIVLQYTLDGEFIAEWPSTREIKRVLNIRHAGDVCRGDRKQAGGFIWKYKDAC